MWKIAVPVLLVALLVGGALYYRSHQQSKRLTEKDTIVLAYFANSTGDAVFDDTLKTALSVTLRQSPFLSLLSDDRVGATLKLMTLAASQPLTPELAREVCQRAHSKAYIAGSIAPLGSEYVLGLRAVNCQSGDTLAQEQVTAASKEKVLDALGVAASKLRNQLGESLTTVQKFDTLIEQATTPSLEALKAFSSGRKVLSTTGSAAAIPFFKHAIELDPLSPTPCWDACMGTLGNPARLPATLERLMNSTIEPVRRRRISSPHPSISRSPGTCNRPNKAVSFGYRLIPTPRCRIAFCRG